jgi:ferrous iron transport protein B
MNPKHKMPKVAVLGNPNSGKSSLFNYLTGLRQDVSNFPGVTVDKKTAFIQLTDTLAVEVIDFPGTYSVFPNSSEEKLVINTITNPQDDNFPDAVIYVADVMHLDRHLLFATQIKDLGFPMILIINMIDLADDAQIKIHKEHLASYLQCEVLCISVRNHVGLDDIKPSILSLLNDNNSTPTTTIYHLSEIEQKVATQISEKLQISNLYRAKLVAHHAEWLDYINTTDKQIIKDVIESVGFQDIRLQVQETLMRFEQQDAVIKATIHKNKPENLTVTDKIDQWITHRFWGPVIFFVIMFLVFQAIYTWAELPMEWIERGFAWAGNFMSEHLTESWWSDLLVNGLLAGLGGVFVFVPQIALLFFLIALLEESGYMSRVVFMFDSVMQRFGMNGRSMVSLISSGACAIPAIMATRTISNQKERLITIMVSPLISCSARLPVYAVLIGFVVPNLKIGGFINLQGLAFMGLYLLGIVGVILSSIFFKKILKSQGTSHLMIEMPNYKPPLWTNVFLMVKEKVTAFIIGAGKIILLISVVLWFLASYGPSDEIAKSVKEAEQMIQQNHLDEKASADLMASHKLEASYIGHLGKWIEPSIRPLGFDWKIGIALLTSFAAREVFVGTMATIYSIGSDSDEKTIREKMAEETRPNSQIKVYNPATALSLLVFYVFAMQCMSTLAVTRRETNTWKWPIVQFFYMGIMAYFGAFITYQLMT